MWVCIATEMINATSEQCARMYVCVCVCVCVIIYMYMYMYLVIIYMYMYLVIILMTIACVTLAGDTLDVM